VGENKYHYDKWRKDNGLTESEFDWADQGSPISVGMVFKVLGNDYPNQILAKMEIVKVTNFFQDKTRTQLGGDVGETTLERALQLIDEKYWVPMDEYGHGVDSWGNKLKSS
jgi:hypothetical protein